MVKNVLFPAKKRLIKTFCALPGRQIGLLCKISLQRGKTHGKSQPHISRNKSENDCRHTADSGGGGRRHRHLGEKDAARSAGRAFGRCRSCELQPITAVSADGCRLRLKMSLEPQNRTETGRILALEKQIAANIAAGLRQYPCRDLSPGADPRILHGELRKQIDHAIAPAKIKNIRFSRLSE